MKVAGDGVELAVREVGDPSTPTVVLVHGYPDTSEVWAGVAAHLADRYHVVTYDVRGAGASSAPKRKSDYALAHLVNDLAAVVDAVSPERPVHLVGHDWGSIQSWEAVTTERLHGRIASYTSMSGPCLDHVGYWLRDHRSLRPSALRELIGQGARSWYVLAFHLPGLAPLAWRLGLAKRWPQVLERVESVKASGAAAPTLADDAARGVNLYRANVLSRLTQPNERRTDVPVQLIVPLGDHYVSPALLDGVERWAPNLWRRDVPGRHWLPRIHPGRVARWISEFVDHIEGGAPSPGLVRARGGVRFPDAGRVVVVTGAGSGIGRQTALAFAERGAEVIAADIDAEAAARTAKLCHALGTGVGGGGGTAHSYQVDVGDADAMEAFAKGIEHDHGAPDIVVNNAGIGMAGPLLETTVDDWERVLKVNLWGVIHGSRLFGRQMVERGEGGHIVNVASAAAFTPSRAYPAYATSKAAALMLTECLRAELASEGIGVSAICPALVNTGIVAATRYVGVSDDEQDKHRRAAGRLYTVRNFTPDKVAEQIIRAVDDDAAVVPVMVEAKVTRLLSRFAPGLMRRLARYDVTP